MTALPAPTATMSPKNPNTHGPLHPLVLALLGTLFGAGVTWGVSMNRLDALERSASNYVTRTEMQGQLDRIEQKIDLLYKREHEQ